MEDGDATPVGMMHHSSGNHFSLELSTEFGLTLKELESVPEGVNIPRPGCNTTHEHHHHDEDLELSFKKRQQANGTPSP